MLAPLLASPGINLFLAWMWRRGLLESGSGPKSLFRTTDGEVESKEEGKVNHLAYFPSQSFPKVFLFCLNYHFQELSPSCLLRSRHATLTTIFSSLATHLDPSPSLHKRAVWLCLCQGRHFVTNPAVFPQDRSFLSLKTLTHGSGTFLSQEAAQFLRSLLIAYSCEASHQQCQG